ncbi:MAG: DUF202 domain-containing protein [Pseudomonadota bacterium]
MSDKTDLAEDRTDWAEDRTILALERTYTSWMGLGLGAVGVALGLHAVFGAAEEEWIPKAMASLFLAVAIGIFWTARRQACKTYARLSTHDTAAQTPRTFTTVAVVLTIAT